MKKILLFTLLPILAFSYELSFNKLFKKNHLSKDENISYLMLSNTYRLEYNELYLRFTPVVYLSTGDEMYNDTNQHIDRSRFFFKDLYIKYIKNEHSFGFGLLPFTDSRFTEYNRNYVIGGEGLNQLIDLNFMNFFYIYQKDDFKYKMGFGKQSWLNDIPKGDYISKYNLDTTSIWNVFEYNYNNFKIYNMNILVQPKYEDKRVGDLFLSGIGIAYDRREDLGLTIYNTTSFSTYKNKSFNVKDNILSNNNLIGYDYYFPENFDFNNNRTNGFSNLLGIRKDFDTFREVFINLEWFYASNGWMSVNQGARYNGSFHTDQAVRNNSYMCALGINLDNSTVLKFSYSYIERVKRPKIGNPTNVIDTSKHFIKDNKEEYFYISLVYNF